MRTILIVDDNQQNLYLLQALLSANSFHVEQASNGAEALEKARCGPPDIVVSDILMPVMDGFALCRAWRRDDRLKNIPFVFYTATYTNPKDEKFALSLGADRFIIKPAEPDEFLAVIYETIKKHEVNKPIASSQLAEETEYYKEYNAALIRKLEDKMLQLEEANRVLERDIAEREKANYRREFAMRVLAEINRNNDIPLLIGNILHLFKEHTKIEAVGIRLRDGDDFPYYETNGFPSHFVEDERYLCVFNAAGDIVRNPDGSPVLECLCGNVICGRIDPSMPFFTPYGSFWTNCATEFLASTTEKDRQTRTRNRCTGEGYESVALIPVRSGDEVIGLLQFNDHRKGLFTLDRITFFEEMGASIGIAVARQKATKDLRESEDKFRSLAENSYDVIYSLDAETQEYRYISPNFAELLGYTEEDIRLMGGRGKFLTRVMGTNFESLNSKKFGLDSPLSNVFEAWWVSKSGEQRYILDHWRTVTQDGKLLYVNGILRDITDKKRAEEELVESRASLNRAQEVAHLGSWDWKVAGSKLRWSEELYRIFGMDPRTELTYDGIVERLHPDDRAMNQEFVDRLLSKNDIADMEFRIIRPDGIVRNIFQQAIVRRDANGNPVHIFGIMQDITERKHAEEAIIHERILLKTIIDNIPLAVYAKDTECRKVLANSVDLINFNMPESEVIGHTDRELFPEDVAERTMADDLSVIENGKRVINREELIINKKGEQRWLLTSKIPWRDKEENIVGLVGIGYDITERKRAEEVLKKSEARLRSYFELSGAGIAITSPTKNWVEVNDYLCEMFGYSKEELYQKTWPDLTHPDDMELDFKYFNQIMKGERDGYSIDKRFVCKDENIIWVNLSVHCVRFADGKVDYFIALLFDITERKQAEEDRERLQKRLQQSQKLEAIGTLAGGIAHDFNNILSAIIGYSELSIPETPEGSQIRSDLEKILQAGNRAKGVVNQILTFSRQRDEEKSPLIITPIVKEVMKLLRASLPSTITVKTNIRPGIGSVIADPSQIHQVIMNLCTNAAHAMKKSGGTLTITLDEITTDDTFVTRNPGMATGRYVQLTVSDTGHGMNSDVMERIFEPYFTTKGPGEGSGLGLSIVHGIVDSMKGIVNVYSELGKGSTFKVYLPITDKGPTSTQKQEDKPYTGQGRILFVDDEPMVVEIGSRILKGLGYEVTEMTSSVEALEHFQKNSATIDLVITDMTMPFIPGDELARDILEIRPGMPVIICTGYSDRLTAEDAKAMGIRHYLGKPLLKSEIAEKVHQVLAKSREETGYEN